VQTLKFTYSSDNSSSFTIELTSEGSRITGSDLVLMGKYIRLLFATIRQIGEFNGSTLDVDEIIRKIMNGDDE
jgi:hypothetical protein